MSLVPNPKLPARRNPLLTIVMAIVGVASVFYVIFDPVIGPIDDGAVILVTLILEYVLGRIKSK